MQVLAFLVLVPINRTLTIVQWRREFRANRSSIGVRWCLLARALSVTTLSKAVHVASRVISSLPPICFVEVLPREVVHVVHVVEIPLEGGAVFFSPHVPLHSV